MTRDERVYPDLSNGNFAFHLFRYLWAIPFAYDRVVLDAGCGAGYGSDLLAIVARSVVAVDYDPQAIADDRTRYGHRTNLTFLPEDVAELSFADKSFDLIVSFEVYEHLDLAKSERFLERLSRLCRRGGHVLLSTPNRLVEGPFMRAAGQSNPHHINSVSPRVFKGRLRAYFKSVSLYGQRIKAGPAKAFIRACDPLNLRHRLFSQDSKERLNRVLIEGPLAARPDFRNIQIARTLVRQSGVILALCSK